MYAHAAQRLRHCPVALALHVLFATVQRGVDYEPLRQALREKDFLTADDIHRKKLIEVAGAAARERGWVYFSEVRPPVGARSSQICRSRIAVLSVRVRACVRVRA